MPDPSDFLQRGSDHCLMIAEFLKCGCEAEALSLSLSGPELVPDLPKSLLV